MNTVLSTTVPKMNTKLVKYILKLNEALFVI
jgi:hypothetical protein